MSYYNEKFVKKEFVKKIREMKGVWKPELEAFVLTDLLDFKKVSDFVISKF